MNDEGYWGLAIIVGPIILGILLAYGILRSRKLTRAEAERREQATRENYGKEEKK